MPPSPADVRAAVSVVGHRPEPDSNPLDFSNSLLGLNDADLPDADLFGADLFGADPAGADLAGAKLPHADLSGADLRTANLLPGQT